jgi:hypothetical protein
VVVVPVAVLVDMEVFLVMRIDAQLHHSMGTLITKAEGIVVLTTNARASHLEVAFPHMTVR